MKCTYCNAENADGAVFCSSCGKRIDGKKACPTCGALNPEAAGFCSTCGANLKAQPAPQPAPQPAAPAPQPVVAPSPAYNNAPAYAAPVAEAAAPQKAWQKIVLLVGAICGAVAVVFSLIFFFLIGVDAVAQISGGGMNESEVGVSYGIGYWLGTIWNNPEGLTPGVAQYFELMEYSGEAIIPAMALMMNGMYGVLIFAVIGIILVVFAIRAIIAYVKYFTKKPGKDITGLAITVYFAYALAATLIKSLMAMGQSASGDGMSEFTGIVYNGATMAGLIIGGIMIGLLIVSKLVVQGKALLKKNVLIPGIISICAVIFAAVTWALASGTLFGISESEMGYSESLMFGFMGFSTTYASAAMTTEELIMAVMMSASAQTFVGIAIIMASRLTVKHIAGLATGKTEKDLRFAIVTLIFVVFSLVCTFTVFSGDTLEILRWDEGFSTTPLIVTLVMAVISLGLTIAGMVVRSQLNKAQPPVYQA